MVVLYSAFLIFVDLGLIAFTIYRMSVRQALPVEEQESFVMHTPASIHEELDPRTEYQDYSLYVDEVWEQVESLAKDHPSKAIALIRGLSNKNPEWAASLAEKAAQLDNIDTVVLFRSLTLTNPDFSIEIAKKLAESEHEQVDEIVEWLIEKEPENTMQILVTISDAMEEQPNNLVETLAEQSPEKLAEFSQELVANMVETNQNLRLADREESDINESVEEFITTIAESAPEQVEEITQLVEQSIQEHEEQTNPNTP